MNLVETTNTSPIFSACGDSIRDLSTDENGDDDAEETLLSLVVPLLVALTVQAAMASEHHRMRAKGRTVAIEQFRNSNAFAAPGGSASQSALSANDEAAMTSGLAGH